MSEDDLDVMDYRIFCLEVTFIEHIKSSLM